MHDLIKDFAPSYHARTCLINLYIHACIHIKYQTSESSCASCHQKPSPFLENILHQSPHSCSHTYKTLYVRFVMCILSDAPNELNDLQTCSSMKHKQMCTQALTSNHLVHTLSIIFFLASELPPTSQIRSAVQIRWMKWNETALQHDYLANNIFECGKNVSEQRTDPLWRQ